MRALLSRTSFHARLAATFSDPEAIKAVLQDSIPDFPDDLNNWMSRLKLLYGVPFNYLVPDERMLPPESIRFFYVDINWINAMLDGAYSIGRNLTTSDNSAELNADRAILPGLHPAITSRAGNIRAKGLGLKDPAPSMAVISGFLLRSKVISEYPKLGVYAYEKGHTPDDGANAAFMTILRMEKLGDKSDTMLCLVDGDAYRVDIHEAPEHLHYGIDKYSNENGVITAKKNLYNFTKTGNNVTILPGALSTDVSACFRTVSPRTLKMHDLAGAIQNRVNVTPFDSAEMGFEMTEGVGLVSFYNQSSQ